MILIERNHHSIFYTDEGGEVKIEQIRKYSYMGRDICVAWKLEGAHKW